MQPLQDQARCSHFGTKPGVITSEPSQTYSLQDPARCTHFRTKLSLVLALLKLCALSCSQTLAHSSSSTKAYLWMMGSIAATPTCRRVCVREGRRWRSVCFVDDGQHRRDAHLQIGMRERGL